MYFPYLRGRQYELIALRELLENNKLSNNVIPIIEPVRLSPTLVSTLEGFKDRGEEVFYCNESRCRIFFGGI